MDYYQLKGDVRRDELSNLRLPALKKRLPKEFVWPVFLSRPMYRCAAPWVLDQCQRSPDD